MCIRDSAPTARATDDNPSPIDISTKLSQLFVLNKVRQRAAPVSISDTRWAFTKYYRLYIELSERCVHLEYKDVPDILLQPGNCGPNAIACLTSDWHRIASILTRLKHPTPQNKQRTYLECEWMFNVYFREYNYFCIERRGKFILHRVRLSLIHI